MLLLYKINNKTQKHNTMKKPKNYLFRYFDKDQNETHSKVYQFTNIKEARKHANIMLWNSNDNTASIQVTKHI